jgi:hypothetical protein
VNPRKNLGATNISWIHQTKFQILVSIPTWNFRFFEKGKESGIQQIKKERRRRRRRRAKVDKLKGEEQKTCAWKMMIHGGKQCKYYRTKKFMVDDGYHWCWMVVEFFFITTWADYYYFIILWPHKLSIYISKVIPLIVDLLDFSG